MYCWCTKDEWRDDFFDVDWLFNERGCFPSYEEAKHDATKSGYDEVVVFGYNDDGY